MKKILSLCVLVLGSQLSFGQNLKGSSWVLLEVTQLDSGRSVLTRGKLQASLQFDSDSLFSGLACNHHDGRYSAGENRSLKMKIVVAMKAPCLGMGDFEKELLAHYDKANKYKMIDDVLFIFCSDGYRLKYSRQKK